jgi:tetratricopeptide (TPR) repeat protein
VQRTLAIILFVIALLQACASKQVVSNNNTNTSTTNKVTAKAAEIYYDAGQLRLKNECKTAIEKYKQSITLLPSNDAAYYYLGICLKKEGNLAEAEQALGKAYELQAQNEFYADEYAQVLNANKKTDKAIAIYKQLAALKTPSSTDYLMQAAYYCMKKNNYKEALELLNTVNQGVDIDEELQLKKIRLHRLMDNTPKAIELLDELKKQNPKDAKYDLIKIDVYEDAQDTNKANTLLRSLAISHPQDPVVITKLTMYSLSRKDTAQYYKLLESTLNNKQIEPETKAALMMPILKQAETDSSIIPRLLNYSEKLVQAAPQDKQALSIHANILSTARKLPEAAKVYQQLIRIEPNKFDNWRQTLALYAASNKYDSVLSVAERALQYFPTQAYIYYIKGYAYQQLTYNDKAIAQLKTAQDYSEGNNDMQVMILTTLADTYNNLKRFSESDAAFDQALKLDPADATVLNNYAYYLSVRNTRLQDAEQMSKKSLALRQNEKTFLDTYAWILYKQGKYQEALVQQQKALEAPGDTDATLLEHLGDIYYKLDDKTKAMQYWQQAKGLGNANEQLLKKITNKQLYE